MLRLLAVTPLSTMDAIRAEERMDSLGRIST